MPENDIEISGKYVTLSKKGKIVIKENYAWDGPSGPTIENFLFRNFIKKNILEIIVFKSPINI